MRILVFAGTSEGRHLADYLKGCGADFTLFVATDYGNSVIPKDICNDIRVGRLNEDDMRNLFNKEGNIIVIDATHPYATEVSINIKNACGKDIPYIRLLRAKEGSGQFICVKDVEETIKELNKINGNILLTTGSKDLEHFTKVTDYNNRIYVRVLPESSVITNCEKLGYKRSNIICMQGPCSKEMNKAFLKETKAKVLVTKDTGSAGGFSEKTDAALELGVSVIVISRPVEEKGFLFEELKKLLANKYGIKPIDKLDSGYFPIFVPISGKKVLIIGGGNVASRRVASLLPFNPIITVISKDVSEYIKNSGVSVIKKSFDESDIDTSYSLIIAATDNRLVNKSIGYKSKELGILVSVADMKDEGSFFFPAIIQGGGVTGGLISSHGDNHNLVRDKASEIRRIL